MLRRNAILLACSAIPTACLPAAYRPPVVSTEEDDDDDDDDREQQEVDGLAKTLASSRFAALKESHPDDWQSLSYVADARVREDLTAIYCVTSDPKLIDLWAARVERAMSSPGKLRVHAVGLAGSLGRGPDAVYHVVTLLICNRESVELERVAFLDLKAKYPEPAGSR